MHIKLYDTVLLEGAFDSKLGPYGKHVPFDNLEFLGQKTRWVGKGKEVFSDLVKC